MEELSYPVSEWLWEFRREAGRRSMFSGAKWAFVLLARIEEAGEPAAAFGLITPLPKLSAAVRERTAAAVERLVATLDADAILRFARNGWHRTVHEKDVQPWVEGPDASMTAVRAVLTCHPNGFMREAALRRLRGCEADYVIGFTLLRLSDWVPQVRAAAAELIEDWIEEGRGEEWGPWLKVLFRVARSVRDDQAALVERIESAVGATDAVLEALDSPDKEVRRYAAALALPRPQAIERGRQSPDPVIRLRCAEADPGAAETLANDSYAPIRKLVLKTHPERAHSYLFDRTRSVRSLARQLFDRDAAPIYRSALGAREPASLPAWRGLAECGDASDSERFVGALAHPRAAIRAAALGGLARVSPEPPLAEAWAAMGDGSARVRRAALRILLRHPLLLDEASVRRLLASAREPSRVRHAWALASALPKWRAGTVILEATRSVHTETAQEQFWRWFDRFNQSFERPTRAQATAFRAALSNAALDGPARSAAEDIYKSMVRDA